MKLSESLGPLGNPQRIYPMQTAAPSLALAPLDELTQLELSVAQRADELMRLAVEPPGRRDYWLEAEAEILEARLGPAVRRIDLPARDYTRG